MYRPPQESLVLIHTQAVTKKGDWHALMLLVAVYVKHDGMNRARGHYQSVIPQFFATVTAIKNEQKKKEWSKKKRE